MYIISFNFEELLKCKYKLKNRMDKTGIAFARLRAIPGLSHVKPGIALV